MRKYHLTSITIAVLISLMTANNEGINCNVDDSGQFRTYQDSNELQLVTQLGNSSCLALDLTNISKIPTSTFAITEIKIDTLKLSAYPNSSSCTPKFIQIVPKSFYGLSEVNKLELNCLLFSEKYFVDFPSLIELKLEDNDIAIIVPKLFDKINKGLEELIIINKISEIEPESFAKFSSLKRLVLNGGQLLQIMESYMFSGLDNLKYLDLNNNRITVLHAYTFRPLSQLENLYLRHNIIRKISEYTFFGLKNLRKLDLAHNNLIHVGEGLFDDLHKLEYLNISWNSLTCIGAQEFEQTSSLQTLDLSNNRITCLEWKSFYGLNLKTLTLMNNKLTKLGSQVFANLHVEKLLDLRGSNITCIDESTFQGLRAEQVSLCYQGNEHVTGADQGYWGIAGNSIKDFIYNDCGK